VWSGSIELHLVAAAGGAVQSTNMDSAVDGSRVGLWGVSYGGAHVLVTAAKFGSNISAVIANVSASA
jgi:dipeptidyl aminopeptidase/acylaminoacyl peptidase